MKVSIITTSYNSASTIRDTLLSVAAQDYPHIEHIVIDGGSTDGTLNIVSEFPHIAKVVSEKDKGIYDAMNKGIHLATGDLIGILNSDDFYTNPKVLSNVVSKIWEDGTDTLYANLDYVDSLNTKLIVRTWISGNYSQRKFRFGWMPPHPTFFVKKSVYDKYGLFDLSFTTAADYEIMLRFLLKNHVSTSYLPETIVHMRAGGHSNASLSHRLKANAEDSRAWKKNKLTPYFFTTILKPARKIHQFFPNKK
jgi:glycosyltransferase involved in cell wall biosynthesis